MSLRDYFSEAAPYNVLSVAYNPDAKYAFVNFTSEGSRAAAITHAATNMFEGRRLDCRIRQGSMSRSTKVHYGMSYPGRASFTVSSQQSNSVEQQAQELLHFPEVLQAEWGKDKYFILKSFSLDALSRSIETGQWYIPKRHCTRLNIAFKSARRVYFVFSVNGSGTFAGVALMKSETLPETKKLTHQNDIHRSTSTGSEGSLQSSMISDPSSLEAGMRIPTLASDRYAPGTICYEPERRRIVWEAVQGSDQASEDDDSSFITDSPTKTFPSSPWETTFESRDIFAHRPRDMSSTSHKSPFKSPSVKALWDHESQSPAAASSQKLQSKLEQFGNPCQIEWLSTTEIPFDEVRGIKNSWNSNKEVHVARNVTAIETRAASYLLKSWGINTEAS
ncbi:uncharacterized protein A1O9_11101 [Exophiala aquamarina CBS 119918]|uniref:YTH domain-containing protein n=1 Tax=Exophiala aquamarina CBS 119918 TaxID=1182545 RepID=A0A072NXS4_9EURO|nr:uncharacterized protein A1O9_11101 [Exophiala aquamarina CBS 119918]KEF52684.1 hypothetical protein A1O9_11101 [Exophiala aquamarina CBS 119918]